MQRVVEILLSGQDEEELLRTARARFPSVRVLDSVPWASPENPPIRGSLRECSGLVTVWNPELHPVLPSRARSNGTIHGPQIGPVIQWIRSVESPPGVLQAGRWAASVNNSDKPMIAFIKDIWKVLLSETSNALARRSIGSDELIPDDDFLIGRDALSRAQFGELQLKSGFLQLYPRVSPA